MHECKQTHRDMHSQAFSGQKFKLIKKIILILMGASKGIIAHLKATSERNMLDILSARG